MLFQESCLYSDDSIINCVALVKPVSGKFLPVIEDLSRRLGLDLVIDCPFNKLLAVFLEFSWDFFCDRFAQIICLRWFISRQLHCSKHELLLVYRIPVGFSKN